MSATAVENTGVHLHALINRIGCGIHKVPVGVPCYHLPNNMTSEAYYVGACGSRVKRAGYNGKISPQSMRAKAPAKRKTDATNKQFGKNFNASSARKFSK
jgi:hypothetical protein